MSFSKRMRATEDARRRHVLAEELIDRGFRRVAARLHPDHGGSHADMVLLVEVRDWILQLTGARRSRVPPRPVGRPRVVVPTLGCEDEVRQALAADDGWWRTQLDRWSRIGAALAAARTAIPDRRTYLAWLHALGLRTAEADKLIEFAALTAKVKGK
jgi:hypothetical protein